MLSQIGIQIDLSAVKTLHFPSCRRRTASTCSAGRTDAGLRHVFAFLYRPTTRRTALEFHQLATPG
jgi:hypothetical protein